MAQPPKRHQVPARPAHRKAAHAVADLPLRRRQQLLQAQCIVLGGREGTHVLGKLKLGRGAQARCRQLPLQRIRLRVGAAATCEDAAWHRRVD